MPFGVWFQASVSPIVRVVVKVAWHQRPRQAQLIADPLGHPDALGLLSTNGAWAWSKARTPASGYPGWQVHTLEP